MKAAYKKYKSKQRSIAKRKKYKGKMNKEVSEIEKNERKSIEKIRKAARHALNKYAKKHHFSYRDGSKITPEDYAFEREINQTAVDEIKRIQHDTKKEIHHIHKEEEHYRKKHHLGLVSTNDESSGNSRYLLQKNGETTTEHKGAFSNVNTKVVAVLSTVLMLAMVVAILLSLNKKKELIGKRVNDCRDEKLYELVR